jgi:hypothetical protein
MERGRVKYVVDLSEAERAQLEAILHKGKSSARRSSKAGRD